MLDVFIVRLREWARLDGVVERKDGMPVVNLSIIDDAHHRFEASLGDVENPSHIDLYVFARDGVGRQCGGRRGDGGIRGCGSFCGSVTRGFHQSPWAQSQRQQFLRRVSLFGCSVFGASYVRANDSTSILGLERATLNAGEGVL